MWLFVSFTSCSVAALSTTAQCCILLVHSTERRTGSQSLTAGPPMHLDE